MDCVKKTLEEPVCRSSENYQANRMTMSDIAEDRKQWRELVVQASMAESSWMMKT